MGDVVQADVVQGDVLPGDARRSEISEAYAQASRQIGGADPSAQAKSSPAERTASANAIHLSPGVPGPPTSTATGQPPNGRDELPAYAELHCLSNSSFLRGASWPEELVQQAKELSYSAIAITDECSLAGAPRAHFEAKKLNLTLVIGASFRLAGDDAPTLVALAKNREGYGNLSEMITLGRTRAEKGSYLITHEDFARPAQPNDHLRGLPDCFIILAAEHGVSDAVLDAQTAWACQVFGDRLRMGLTLHRRADDDRHQTVVQTVADRHGVPVVATGRVVMHTRARQTLHDTMTAIRLSQPVAQCGYSLAPNGQAHLRQRVDLAQLYPLEAMAETQRITENCLFRLSELEYEYPDEVVPEGTTPASFLRSETYIGAAKRFPTGIPEEVIAQIEKELALIAEKKYEPYFLTVYDIVKFARDEGILCQGRGSAANSAVCYCLHITEVDPKRGNNLFERFISRERDEAPDIDVDFEHQRREEVIQYIYRKYGRLRAALTAVVISYRPRSVLRDTGRALGIDAGIIDAVAKSHHYWDGRAGFGERLASCGLDPNSSVAQQWVILAERLASFPRHLSQHPGGFVISRGKLSRLVPIENAAMADRSVVQWDKDDIESLGLMKVDVLALGMLSVVRRALELVALRRQRPFIAQDIKDDDVPTFDMICKADTIGVFQIESRAQMSMLPRLRPRVYYDLVIQVAIVRPGPIQGGMVHPYLKRRQKLEEVTYPGALKPALERTEGVPIFQEQVMQIAMIAADFTPGEADQLRRSMAAWKRKGGLQHYYDKITKGMARNGYEPAFAEQIFAQIQGFGEYGFPESHAAGFALIAYQSAWLKCHEPEAFLAALLNSQPMGFYSPSTLVQDAQRHGVVVRPVDVMTSDWDATLEEVASGKRLVAVNQNDDPQPPLPHSFVAVSAIQAASQADECADDEADRSVSPWTHDARWSAEQAHLQDYESMHGTTCTPATAAQQDASEESPRPAVRLGMSLIKGMDRAAATRIAEARAVRPFTDMNDLALRADLNRAQLQALGDANALYQFAGHRRQALWQAVASAPDRGLLRHAGIEETEQPVLAAPTEGENLVSDYRSLALTLGRHPLALLRGKLSAMRFASAAQLQDYPSGRLARACGIVTVRQRPGTSKGTIFVTLEDETGVVNVIVWPRVVERQRQALLGSQLMGVYGTWQNENKVRHLVAGRLVNLSPMLGELGTRSRNFH
ncbi:error-prone DNA polymerase [Pigmentiphaga aceris]|uniref:Error-prone DNA polymerase n=1 Tax=Pigmentiphaga aceris TaxID=1940612 RepID=A0A5C0AY21_9BURK|nr:error-prone DNA polymerase [Pigmentiphaga aceris]QEI07278.1 error-prone DNA polymerase [Pigmentiphaga aceris]